LFTHLFWVCRLNAQTIPVVTASYTDAQKRGRMRTDASALNSLRCCLCLSAYLLT